MSMHTVAVMGRLSELMNIGLQFRLYRQTENTMVF